MVAHSVISVSIPAFTSSILKVIVSAAFDKPGNNLDAIRLAFAILVILTHAWPTGKGEILQEPMMQLTRLQVGFGGIAVGGFFIISGFLITNSFLRSRSLWTYLKKRVARIYPGFIVCMIVCATIVVPLSHAHFTHQGVLRNVAGFLATTFALREFGYTGAFPSSHIHYINGSMWTVSNEFYCYLLVPVLGLVGALRKRVVLLGMFVMSTALVEVLPVLAQTTHLGTGLGHFRDSIPGHFQLLNMFLAGMAFFVYREKIPHKTSLALVSLCMLVIASRIPHTWYATFGVAGSYLIFWIGFHPRIRFNHAARHGDFSYGVYLYAFPIQMLLTQAFGGDLNPWLNFLMATPLSVLAAVASWHGVEKWFLSGSRRRGVDAPILKAQSETPVFAQTPAIEGAEAVQ